MERILSLPLSLSLRTVDSPGSYSIGPDGILNFPTIEDFHQTADYIFSDSSEFHLHLFRNSLPFQSINKRADQVIDSIESLSLSVSTVASNFLNYGKFINLHIETGDTMVTRKFGAWGEFLNYDYLVRVEGGLYWITGSESVYIADGDINKLGIAHSMEASDTMQGIYINWRACACDPTGYEWRFTKVVYSGNNHRITSKETFSNLTLWKKLPNGKVEIKPRFAHNTEVHIQKRGIVWFCHRMHFNWNRQVHVSHNLQLPASPNTPTPNLWFESTGWDNHYECKFKWDKTYPFPAYVTDPTWDMQAGYCLAVKIFSQNVETVDNPLIYNGWYFYPYPNFDMSGFYGDPLGNCWNFNWLYQL